MSRALIGAMVLIACGKDEPQPARTDTATGSGSAQKPPDVAPSKPDPKPPSDDGSAEVARMVVRDVGSKALGSQAIDPACVSVSLVPAGDWTVAAARLEGCGDKNARSIVWLYKRRGSGKWNEDYVGQPPKCWKAVPPDLAPAVAIATKIKTC
jgi:hypothetical protein